MLYIECVSNSMLYIEFFILHYSIYRICHVTLFYNIEFGILWMWSLGPGIILEQFIIIS